jgi:hypothetical protein
VSGYEPKGLGKILSNKNSLRKTVDNPIHFSYNTFAVENSGDVTP